MYRIYVLIICLIPGSAIQAQSGWELRKDKDDIVIYTRESPDNHLKEYRVSALIECPLQEMVGFALDLEIRPQWVINCKGLRIIDTVGERIRYHTVYEIPWPFKDRDLLVAMELVARDSVRAHLLTRSIELDYPLEEDVVRMSRYREEIFYEKLDENSTMFRAEGFADPGGKLPPWLVNMFLVDGVYDSVIKTREAVAASNR